MEVVDVPSMQRLIRANNWKTDPLADGDSCDQLCCRDDLQEDEEDATAAGGIDGKVTNSTMVKSGLVLAVAGMARCGHVTCDRCG